MLTKILDALGVQQTVVTASQEAVVNKSGTITATGVSQTLAAANALRSGWFFQNNGSNPMYLNEVGADASATSNSFVVQAGGTFPPAGFALTTAKISVLGTIGEAFTCREW